MKLIKKTSGLLLLLIVFSVNAFSQQTKFKALIIYNFTKYIEWPNIINDEFVIYVLDNKELSDELNAIAKVKSVGTSKLVIKDASTVEEIKNCQIIYVPQKRFKELSKCIEKCTSNILFVTEFTNGCQNGAGINFVSNEGKLNFEIKKSNITSKGLTVSNELLKLGKELN